MRLARMPKSSNASIYWHFQFPQRHTKTHLYPARKSWPTICRSLNPTLSRIFAKIQTPGSVEFWLHWHIPMWSSLVRRHSSAIASSMLKNRASGLSLTATPSFRFWKKIQKSAKRLSPVTRASQANSRTGGRRQSLEPNKKPVKRLAFIFYRTLDNPEIFNISTIIVSLRQLNHTKYFQNVKTALTDKRLEQFFYASVNSPDSESC